jgi:aromatic ring-cleaving dioxygenase
MQSQDAPFHAHVYYTPETREAAVALHSRLLSAMTIARSGVIFVGQMRDYKVGPHPDPQFEVHFLEADLNKIVPVLKSSGLTVLVHPLTRDDLADHTTLADWIGDPIPLDLTTLDPPGVNQGLARFGKTDV